VATAARDLVADRGVDRCGSGVLIRGVLIADPPETMGLRLLRPLEAGADGEVEAGWT
jgi:hypothetical protein